MSHNFTMDVDPGYQNNEQFRSGLILNMMESSDFMSQISFETKIENGNLVSFYGQSITFSLSI